MPCPDIDFDTSSRDEGLRAFLTIVAPEANTQVTITLGPDIVRVLPGSGVPMGLAGDTLVATLGAFDVLNLETAGFMADFTGTYVSASKPVGVFVGSEASDAPMFETYANRQCCADHLEEQLFGDGTLGTQYVIARMPGRAAALNVAITDAELDTEEVAARRCRDIDVDDAVAQLEAVEDRRSAIEGERLAPQIVGDLRPAFEHPTGGVGGHKEGLRRLLRRQDLRRPEGQCSKAKDASLHGAASGNRLR